MTFTYTPGTPDDTTRVRFHISDTSEAGALLTDETIAFAIAESGSWQKAVIWCIDYMIGQLALEDGQTLDWLQLDYADGMKYLERLRAQKVRALGVGGAAAGNRTATAAYVRRHDTPTSYDKDDVG